MDSQPEEDHEAKVEEGVEDPDTPSIEAAAGSHPRPALHHLTRHWLPEDERGEGVLERFGAPTLEAARQMVRTMGQRELRAAFQRVYGSPTQSFNNNWLRRKLLEALGLRAQPAGRSTPSGQGRPRREKKGRRIPTASVRERPTSAPPPAAPTPSGRRHQTRAASAVDAEAAAASGLNTIAGAIDLISPLGSPLRSPLRSPGSGLGLSPQGTMGPGGIPVITPGMARLFPAGPLAQPAAAPAAQQAAPVTPRVAPRESSMDASQAGAWLPAGVPVTPRGPDPGPAWEPAPAQHAQPVYAPVPRYAAIPQLGPGGAEPPVWRNVGDFQASEALAYYYQLQQQAAAEQAQGYEAPQPPGNPEPPPAQGGSGRAPRRSGWGSPRRPSSTPL